MLEGLVKQDGGKTFSYPVAIAIGLVHYRYVYIISLV